MPFGVIHLALLIDVSLKQDIPAIVVNLIACWVYQKMVGFERKQTRSAEEIGLFRKMTVVQYVNIAAVVLLVNFKGFEEPLLGFVPVLNGTYDDFT